MGLNAFRGAAAAAAAAALACQMAWADVASAESQRIGVIAPLTGGGAPWGVAAAEAAKILAHETNAAGGPEVGGPRRRRRLQRRAAGGNHDLYRRSS